MKSNRREFLATGVKAGVAAGAGAAALAGIGSIGPAFAQAKTKVKLGYLHTPAVDGQIWTGIENGSFARHGIEFEPIQFVTGLELFQAMIGGSLDMLSTGAVVSNFPARGQGKVFLINNVEFATAQLWVQGGSGHQELCRPEGTQDLDHDGNHRARLPGFGAAGERPRSGEGRRDHQPAHGRGGHLVRFGRGAGGGALGAVRRDRPVEGADRRRSWWMPPPTIRRRRSSAAGSRGTSTSRRTATRWRASSRAGRKPMTSCSARSPDAAIAALQSKHYPQVEAGRLCRAVQGVEVLHLRRVAQDARRRHHHPLAAAGDGFLRQGRRHPEPGPGLAVLRPEDLPGDGQGVTARRPTTTSSSAPVRQAACLPTGCRRIRSRGSCCWRQAAGTAASGCAFRSATSAPSTTRGFPGSSIRSRAKAPAGATSSGRAAGYWADRRRSTG